MTQVKVYLCDCCEREFRPGGDWTENANGGTVTVVPDGLNHHITWENLCKPCRTAIHSAVVFVVKLRREAASDG